MNIQILIKEDGELLEFDRSSFPFKIFQNELGNYEELEGLLTFRSEEKLCPIESSSIVSDIFGAYNSINDFLEFEFASSPLNNETTVFKYENFDEQKVKLELDAAEWIVDKEAFFVAILNSSFAFFEALLKTEESDHYKMNLEVIKSLAIKLNLADRLKNLAHSR